MQWVYKKYRIVISSLYFINCAKHGYQYQLQGGICLLVVLHFLCVHSHCLASLSLYFPLLTTSSTTSFRTTSREIHLDRSTLLNNHFLQILFFSCYSAQLCWSNATDSNPMSLCRDQRDTTTTMNKWNIWWQQKKCVTGGEIEIAYIIEWVCSCLQILFICKLGKRQQKTCDKSLVSVLGLYAHDAYEVSYPHQRWFKFKYVHIMQFVILPYTQ